MKKLLVSTVLLTAVLFAKAQQNDTLYADGPGGHDRMYCCFF